MYYALAFFGGIIFSAHVFVTWLICRQQPRPRHVIYRRHQPPQIII